jgi:hypothetical protein
MGRICSIHQPSYWPYLGLFDKIARSDVFIFLDDVQFVKNEFKNRNRLFLHSARSSQRADPGWLTLPVRQEHLDQTIQSTTVMHVSQTMRKQVATIQQAYSAATAYVELSQEIETIYRSCDRDDLKLAEINIAVTEFALRIFDITTEIIGRSSAITQKSKAPTQRLIDLCKIVGADTYLAGAGGKTYMCAEEFERQGIKLEWQEWHPFPYAQVHSPDNFVPYLSCLDLILNQGTRARSFFKGG